jgi:hypothetical protein
MYTVHVVDPIGLPNLCTNIEHVLAETVPVADPVSPPDLSLATERGLAQASRPPVRTTLK